MSIPPERAFQKFGGTSISKVVALSSKVKIKIETLSEAIIVTGTQKEFFLSALAPKITGRSGKTQGERIVKIPARKARRSIVISEK